MSIPPKNLVLFPEDHNAIGISRLYYEQWARKHGYVLIAGVDEAGRGPLAGPVVAAAVIFDQGVEIEGVRDSKQMSKEARGNAFSMICQKALAVGIGVISHTIIDDTNILKASLEAMKRAIQSLEPQPDFLLVDGIHSVPASIHQKCLKKGDQISHSISAASILAKVYRDRLMCRYHEMYPEYGFDKHKGYGTAYHMKAIRRYGPCPIHRMSFKGVIVDQGET